MKILCKLFGHKWSMYAGRSRLHADAVCLRKNCDAKPKGV